MGSPARVKLNPSKLIHGHAVSYKIRSVACVQSTPIKSLSCSHPPRNTSTNLSQSKPRNTSTNISQSKTHVSAEGLGPKDGGRCRWETEGVKMSGGIASHPAAASGAASGGLDQHQDLINDLHGSPPEVWQGFSVRSLETYANKVTDLFTELQSTRGQPYPGKQPQTPAVCEQNPATRDAARARISSQQFSNASAIKTELDLYFSIHHPGGCGVQRENSLGGSRAVFRCTSALQPSKKQSADEQSKCALFLPFRQGGEKGPAAEAVQKYWKMAQQQKKAGVLANEPVWEHSSTCVQQLPVFKTKHLQNHALTQLAVGLNPNITAADTLAFVQVSIAPDLLFLSTAGGCVLHLSPLSILCCPHSISCLSTVENSSFFPVFCFSSLFQKSRSYDQ